MDHILGYARFGFHIDPSSCTLISSHNPAFPILVKHPWCAECRLAPISRFSFIKFWSCALNHVVAKSFRFLDKFDAVLIRGSLMSGYLREDDWVQSLLPWTPNFVTIMFVHMLVLQCACLPTLIGWRGNLTS